MYNEIVCASSTVKAFKESVLLMRVRERERERERERVCVSIEREELGSSFFLPQLVNIRATYKIRSAAGSIETALSDPSL